MGRKFTSIVPAPQLKTVGVLNDHAGPGALLEIPIKHLGFLSTEHVEALAKSFFNSFRHLLTNEKIKILGDAPKPRASVPIPGGFGLKRVENKEVAMVSGMGGLGGVPKPPGTEVNDWFDQNWFKEWSNMGDQSHFLRRFMFRIFLVLEESHLHENPSDNLHEILPHDVYAPM